MLSKLDEATRSGHFNERFRIVSAQGEVRWVWVRGFPVRDAEGKIRRLVGTALEITRRNKQEEEAEALRKATLSLTQDLRMDFIMETLLRSLEELVPYTCARVLVPESGPHMLALGERTSPEQPKKPSPRSPLTFVADESTFFHRILTEQKSVLIADTKMEEKWRTFKGHKQSALLALGPPCRLGRISRLPFRRPHRAQCLHPRSSSPCRTACHSSSGSDSECEVVRNRMHLL